MFPLDRIISVYVDNWKNLFPTNSKMRHKLEDLLVELFFLFDGTFSTNEEASPFCYPEFEHFPRDILSLQYHSHGRLERGEVAIKEEEVDSILTYLKENYNVSYSTDPVIRKFVLSRMEKMVDSFNEKPLIPDLSTSSILLEKKVKIDKEEFKKQYPIKMDKYAEIYIPETAKDSYNLSVSDLKSFGLTIYKDKEDTDKYSTFNRECVSFGYFFQPHPYNLTVPHMYEFEFLTKWLKKDPFGKKNPLETFFGLLSDLFLSLLFDSRDSKEIESEVSSFRSALSYLFYVIKEDKISHLDVEVDRKTNSIKVTPYTFLN